MLALLLTKNMEILTEFHLALHEICELSASWRNVQKSLVRISLYKDKPGGTVN